MAKKKAVTITESGTGAHARPHQVAQLKKITGAEQAALAKNRAKQLEAQAKQSKNKPEPKRAKAKKTKIQPNFHPYIVPALDALIGDSQIIEPSKDTKLKANEMLIPSQYIDIVADMRDESTFRGETAGILLHRFAEILEDMHRRNTNYYQCENGMFIRFIDPPPADFVKTPKKDGATAAAITTAHYYNQKYPGEVAILSGDDKMITKALHAKLDVARINPEFYTGRRKLVLPEKGYEQWFSQGYFTQEQFTKLFPKEEPLNRNEFVEFVFDENILPMYDVYGLHKSFAWQIGRFENVQIVDDYDDKGKPAKWHYELHLAHLHYIENKLPRGIQPRNAGQAMLCEALLSPYYDIAFVFCMATFGTGKTFLSVSIGLDSVRGENPDYDSVFLCPRDSKLGDEVGYLPGDERTKTLAKMMSLIDAVRSYVKNRNDKVKGGKPMSYNEVCNEADRLVEDHIEVGPMNSMGGRNLSDTWIIYDEAQDFERRQIRQLMGRIGEGSKMIIAGDPGQVSNPHMNRYSCGLNYAAVKMRESKCAATIVMTKDEIERSFAALEVARCMGEY